MVVFGFISWRPHTFFPSVFLIMSFFPIEKHSIVRFNTRSLFTLSSGVRSQICPSMFNIKITFIQERALVFLHHAYASSFLPSGCPLRQRSCKHFPPKTKISAVLMCLQKTQESAGICFLQFKFNAVLLRQLAI
jgi:hypothetical protein